MSFYSEHNVRVLGATSCPHGPRGVRNLKDLECVSLAIEQVPGGPFADLQRHWARTTRLDSGNRKRRSVMLSGTAAALAELLRRWHTWEGEAPGIARAIR